MYFTTEEVIYYSVVPLLVPMALILLDFIFTKVINAQKRKSEGPQIDSGFDDQQEEVLEEVSYNH